MRNSDQTDFKKFGKAECARSVAIFFVNYLFAILLVALFMWLTTSFVAVALVLSVIIIALLVINVNAESYVDGLVRKLPAGDKRVKTYAQLESVPAYLRQDSALDETIIDRANDQGGK